MQDHKELIITLAPYALLAGLCVLSMYLLSAGELTTELRYEREYFTEQPWRSVTHAFIHANYRHLGLNLTALVLIFLLFNEAFKSISWLLVLLASAAASSVGLYYSSPDVEWVIGLSGALHGLLVYALLRARASVFWLIALAAKIVSEQLPQLQDSNMLGMSESFIGVPVIADAHLWGAIGGLALFVILQTFAWVRVVIEINRGNK